MDAVSDVTAPDSPIRPRDVDAPPTASLDDLPVEILMKIVSSLDYSSLLSLELVSERCRDAVALYLGRKSYCNTDCGEPGYMQQWQNLSRAQKVTLLSRLTGMRELYVTVCERREGQWLMEALVTASTGWSRLEKLTLELWDKVDPTLLGQLCSNCTRLTDVTFTAGATDGTVEAVVTARHGELRRLRLAWTHAKPSACLASDLARCVRLESLGLGELSSDLDYHLPPVGLPAVSSVLDCLPPDGLPALRHLSLVKCTLTEADLAGVVERQPGLESLSLEGCEGEDLTPAGLALLGRLPAFRSLVLWWDGCTDVLSDWVLDQLSRAPLTELVMGGSPSDLWSRITAEGLLRLIRSCPGLRWATLWKEKDPYETEDPEETIKTIDCRSDAGKRELIRTLGALMTRATSFINCQLSGAAADQLCQTKPAPERWAI